MMLKDKSEAYQFFDTACAIAVMGLFVGVAIFAVSAIWSHEFWMKVGGSIAVVSFISAVLCLLLAFAAEEAEKE